METVSAVLNPRGTVACLATWFRSWMRTCPVRCAKWLPDMDSNYGVFAWSFHSVGKEVGDFSSEPVQVFIVQLISPGVIPSRTPPGLDLLGEPHPVPPGMGPG